MAGDEAPPGGDPPGWPARWSGRRPRCPPGPTGPVNPVEQVPDLLVVDHLEGHPGEDGALIPELLGPPEDLGRGQVEDSFPPSPLINTSSYLTC